MPLIRRQASLHLHGQGPFYKELDECARALAAWLQSRGLVKGDRVAVMIAQYPAISCGNCRNPAGWLRGRQRKPALHTARASAPIE